MATQPRSPAEHYQDAERLLAAAEGSVTDELQVSDALIALGHAILATVPRKQLRGRHSRVANGGDLPRNLRWSEGAE